MLSTASPAVVAATAPSAGADKALLSDHLPLIGHVVRELDLRVPAHIDRIQMWNHGALGLLVAARRHDEGTQAFAPQALRAIRAQVIGGISQQVTVPDEELSAQLGVSVEALQQARAAATARRPMPTPRHRPASQPTDPTTGPARQLARGLAAAYAV